MKVIKEFVYIQSNIYYNDNNFPYMAPFWSDDGKTLQIEEAQYDEWAKTDAIKLLMTKFENIVKVKEVKHFDSDVRMRGGDKLPDWYYDVYNTIWSRACAERWYQLIPDNIIVPVPSDHDNSKLAKDIQDELNKINPQPKNGWFAKCSTCSTKHDYPIEPVFSGVETIQHLMGSYEVKSDITSGKAKYIVLRPWLDEIEKNNELRVFVRQNKVVGASQQACYSACAILSLFDENEVIEACQKCYDDFNNALSEEYRFNYECTFDAYISTNDDAKIIVKLIEINGEMFGWGPAGASLFSWQYNPPPKSDEPPKFMIAGMY